MRRFKCLNAGVLRRKFIWLKSVPGIVTFVESWTIGCKGLETFNLSAVGLSVDDAEHKI